MEPNQNYCEKAWSSINYSILSGTLPPHCSSTLSFHSADIHTHPYFDTLGGLSKMSGLRLIINFFFGGGEVEGAEFIT
jgi:hypothetical protein